jgi:hypothetical protein
MEKENSERRPEQAEQPENDGISDGVNGHGQRIVSYNLNEEERPAGLKVRFKVRILGGKPAAALDARQAEAIREFLKWVAQQEQPPPPPTGGPPAQSPPSP